jgi:hypothetical protein
MEEWMMVVIVILIIGLVAGLLRFVIWGFVGLFKTIIYVFNAVVYVLVMIIRYILGME